MTPKPRVGFLGVGWIGQNRLDAMSADDSIDVSFVSDESAQRSQHVATTVGAESVPPDRLLSGTLDLDAVVIATPSALHGDQTLRALDLGYSVFCQKPLGRSMWEATQVVEKAKAKDLLLGVDMSYRYLDAVTKIKGVLSDQGIGGVFAGNLVFHNAFGPDKDWFFDPALSGGGCAIDLGVHLIDLMYWLLPRESVRRIDSHLFSKGKPLNDAQVAEDYCVATIHLISGAVFSLTCSWFLHAGRNCIISADIYGTKGSLSLTNVNGSFYDFKAVHALGTESYLLAEPPDEWGGRAARAWARSLANGDGFDPQIEEYLKVARAVDALYGRNSY